MAGVQVGMARGRWILNPAGADADDSRRIANIPMSMIEETLDSCSEERHTSVGTTAYDGVHAAPLYSGFVGQRPPQPEALGIHRITLLEANNGMGIYS